jgi:hypothetical protein
VGVLDTPTGALAAADNIVAIASQTVEADPATFTRLVALDYAPSVQAQTQQQATQLRTSDTSNMNNYSAGGKDIALIGARRLSSWTATQATVITWLGGIVWGPSTSPAQTWNLVKTTLEWSGGRWLVTSSSAEASPAPVPSIVYVNAGNNQTPAFNAQLAGMTAPFYGAAG